MSHYMKKTNMDERFKKSVKRICAEAFWINLYNESIITLGDIDAEGLDFFRVAYSSLLDARLTRLIRVFDRNSQSATFWYLHKANESLIEESAKQVEFDLDLASAITDKLKDIRDATFFHIDKDGVMDSEKIYSDADIELIDISHLSARLWDTMKIVHLRIFNELMTYYDYETSDMSNHIRHLSKLRDKA